MSNTNVHGKSRKAAATKEISLYEINKTIKEKFENATLIYPDATKSDTLTVTTNSYYPLFILAWVKSGHLERQKHFDSWDELAAYLKAPTRDVEQYELELHIRKPRSCRGIPVAKLNI